jgi:uncharacterized protein (TIGR00296 family)
MMIECSVNHCEICFDALLSAFKILPHVPNSSVETYDVPMFVTLKKTDGLRQTLRGCIGSLSPRPITDLGEYAKKCAFEDRRFSPLQIHELPFIELSVSLLIDYQDGKNYLDWDLEIHGIIIQFEDEGCLFKATYLPNVVFEMKWTKIMSIDNLIRKSGFNGSITDLLYDKIKLTRYRSSKMKLSYADYLKKKGMVNTVS